MIHKKVAIVRQTDMVSRIRKRLKPIQSETARLLLAVSGGPDSMAMLSLLRREDEIPAKRLVVCTVNHRMRSSAERDVAVVREYAHELGVQFECREVDVPSFVKAEKLSPEAAARKLRYEALEEVAEENGCDWILTGHSMDDSAETVFMRMQSGAPWYEWTGIPARRGRILRPIIDLYRSELMSYVAQTAIPFAADETNLDMRFPRNRIRKELADTDDWTEGSIRELATQGEQLNRQLAELRLIALEFTNYGSKQGVTRRSGLAIKQILDYFNNLAFLPVECAWATMTGNDQRRLPSALRRQIQECVRGRNSKAEIRLPEDFVMLRRGGMIWVCRKERPKIRQTVRPGVTEIRALNKRLVLAKESGDAAACDTMLLDAGFVDKTLTLRNWQPGDRIHARNRPRKKISDLLSEAKADPVERAETMVLSDEDGPLMILGRAVDERALPTENKSIFYRVSWNSIDD